MSKNACVSGPICMDMPENRAILYRPSQIEELCFICSFDVRALGGHSRKDDPSEATSFVAAAMSARNEFPIGFLLSQKGCAEVPI